MNAMQQAMMSSIPRSTQFRTLKGKPDPVSVKPLNHVVIPIRSNGMGRIIRGKKDCVRLVTNIVRTLDNGCVSLRDDRGELWVAEKVSDYVYRARS